MPMTRHMLAVLTFFALLQAVGPAQPATPANALRPATTQTADSNDRANAGRLQLSNYLDAIALKATDARHKMVAAIKTAAEARARQAKVRKQILSLIGPLPARTPLNAKVLGSTQADDFRIEKILFESQPNFPVTALLYLPDNSQGRKLPCDLKLFE